MLAVFLMLGDKEELVAAVEKLREARSYGFAWRGGWAGNEQEGSGETEKSGLTHARFPAFEYAAVGEKRMLKVGGKWSAPDAAPELFRNVGYPQLLTLPALLGLAAGAETVRAGEALVVGGAECRTFVAAIRGKDLRAALEAFLPEPQRAAWNKYDGESFAWGASTGTVTVAVDETGQVRRVSLSFSMEMTSGRPAREFSAEFSIEKVDASRVKLPAELKKPLGLGEG